MCKERAAGTSPSAGVHEPGRGRSVERFDEIERRDDTSFDSNIQCARARQRHELAVVVCAHVGHAPAMTADADEIAHAHLAPMYVVSGFSRTIGAYVGSGFNRTRTCRRTV